MKRLIALVAIGVAGAGCINAMQVPGRADVGEAIRTRTGRDIRIETGPASLPPGVSLAALTREDAVAVALWNSPSFEASLAELGLARADLVEARLLRNPILSLLFPIGPKQLEWTVQFPVDALWQRPRRVAAAEFNTRAIGERLVNEALTLVSDVRLAFVDSAAGERRLVLAAENASLAGRIADIADARLRAGDISDLEARAARSDASQVNAELRALGHERELAMLTLLARMGIDARVGDVTLVSGATGGAAPCAAPEALVEDAVSSRPDIRAAELAIESAARRLSWEQSRIVNLIAILDGNGGRGTSGGDAGPGAGGEIPLFARNEGAVGRASVELQRASQIYLAVRVRVATEVRTAAVRFGQAREASQIWAEEIVPSLEIEARQAEGAYKAGEVALLTVLDTNRRLVQARLRQLDADVSLQRAAVALDRAVGRACASV